MPTFIYKAKDRAGRSVKATESAQSGRELEMTLVRKGFVIISIHEIVREARPRLFARKVKNSDLIMLCKQLSAMLKGGVPLIRALLSMADETENRVVRATLVGLSQHIKSGESLSKSLSKYPQIFSKLFIAMTQAGEKTGSLDAMLSRLSAHIEIRDRLNKKIITALVYPSFIILFFISAMAIFTLFLIPKFREMYSGFGASLPALTRFVFGVSDFCIHNLLWIILAIIIVPYLGHRLFFRTRTGRRNLDRMALKMPLFGKFLKDAALSRFSRTLATLLDQGVPIAEAIKLVGETSGNMILEEASIKLKNLVLDGASLPEALKKCEIFPELMIQMVSVGVESGSLPELLNNTADFYEDKVSNFVVALTNMMEPVLISVLGIIIGVMVVALYLPIFKLSQAIRG